MSKDAFEAKEVERPFTIASTKKQARQLEEVVHQYGAKAQHVCRTDSRGYVTPKNMPLTELKLDAHEGFVPLWEEGVTLRWRFQEQSLAYFANPTAAKNGIRKMMERALDKWGDAVPVKFSEQRDAVDFEVVVRANSDCDAAGCVLASAFFPDAGRHEFVIYPTFFEQSGEEQIETLIHEFGHIFGLRHWFANIYETDWRSEVFGDDGEFTIMNYGEKSTLTEKDVSDLIRLYRLVWSGKLLQINGTPIRTFRPFSTRLHV